MRKILGYFTFLILITQISYASVPDSTRVYGLTLDNVSGLSNIISSLSGLCKKPTTRIVFDEWVAARYYQNPVNQIHTVSFIMGEILDSYYMNQYNLQQYTERTQNYLDTLGNKVDIWEIGNEINGEWCGSTCDVIAKINAAYQIIKSKNKKTAITLYYNKNCWSNSENEMFRWVNNNIDQTMKSGLDYVWISYYEDDCNGYQPNWQRVFDSLHTIFPNSKLGIGECGTNLPDKKALYMDHYYKLKVNTQNFVGGYFWWYFRQDCVPQTDSLWPVFNIAISNYSSPPTVQASLINCSPLFSNSISLSWTVGNGSKRIVFFNNSNSGAPLIFDGITYTANSTYGLGTSDGTGWYCVYNGSGSNLTVTGLNPLNSYRTMILEYNGSPGFEGYNKSTAGNNPRTLRVPRIEIKTETINLVENNPSGNITVGNPSKFELSQNYPNPFNPTTNISFELPINCKVSIKVYDISGREIITLLNETKTAGYYTVMFDASGISSGVYFYRIQTDGFSDMKRMLLVK
jgi:hypothetical protein